MELTEKIDFSGLWEVAWREYRAAALLTADLTQGHLCAAVHIAGCWRAVGRIAVNLGDIPAVPGDVDLPEFARTVMPHRHRERGVALLAQLVAAPSAEALACRGMALDAREVHLHLNVLRAVLQRYYARVKPQFSKAPWYRSWIAPVAVAVLLSAAAGIIFLLAAPQEQFVLTTVFQQWGATRKDTSVLGRVLSIAGTSYRSGIGTHANSELVIVPRAGVTFFSGACGVDDEASPAASIECSIRAGDLPVFDSGLMRKGDAARRFQLPVGKAHEFRLRISDGGDGIDNDHADWVDLRFHNTPPDPFS